ncbi:uncharacterized protein JCM10292_001978 [Rhodotorula paludigena]|uniref:uncharacterized protein n=1 Tax=Rhodotorula paludigena TaxID=86838 RepID=UPI003179A440
MRPVLAVIQPPGGRRDGGAGADSGSGRHEAMRRARLEEQRGHEKGTRAPAVGHARSASDGALARSLAPLPTSHTAAAAPAPSASAAPIHRVPVRSYSEPIRPSPLAPRASLSAHRTSRRGRSPTVHSLSPSAPLSYPPRPALAPLSRRYTRPASHAHLSLRSPVQERSVPHFSRTPLLASRGAAQAQSDGAEAQRRLLVESLVLAALERRLGERLVRARSAAVGDKAGLGGLKAGREMWLWCAVKRCREREGVQGERALLISAAHCVRLRTDNGPGVEQGAHV